MDKETPLAKCKCGQEFQMAAAYLTHIRNCMAAKGNGQIKAFENITESVTWNTEDESRGVYYLKVRLGSDVVVRKFVLE